MLNVIVERIDNANSPAKLTIAADEVRMKFPKTWEPGDVERVQAFFTKVAEKAPFRGFTLRGSVSAKHPLDGITLHTGRSGRASVSYRVDVTE